MRERQQSAAGTKRVWFTSTAFPAREHRIQAHSVVAGVEIHFRHCRLDIRSLVTDTVGQEIAFTLTAFGPSWADFTYRLPRLFLVPLLGAR